jgi:Protein of unknown function (DUF1194)
MRRTGLQLILGCLLAVLAGIALKGDARAQGQKVDVALVLAIDCSFSVDANEFRLQMAGLGRAFLEPEIKKAIRSGPNGQIAVAAIQWSDESSQAVIVPWRIIASDQEADALGSLLGTMPRKLAEGGTSISMAIAYSAKLLTEAPPTDRRVIDISSDGRNNIGPAVNTMRDRIVAQGITINALTILNEWPTLDTYFEKYVIGGQGAFVIPSNDYSAYAEAIYRKLLREITGPGIS